MRPTFHKFSCSDGSWGFTDADGRPVLTVSALGGGQIEIEVADDALAWARQLLPKPNSETTERGFTRLTYRKRYIA
jgi:hypothetical protein